MTKSATDKQWDKWGKLNPYLGVLGIESSSMDQAEVEAAFFSSGEKHIAGVMDTISHHFGGHASNLIGPRFWLWRRTACAPLIATL
jgi:hypothetical protein